MNLETMIVADRRNSNLDALFVSYNLFCIDKKEGGKLVSHRNREAVRNAVSGNCYTIFITFADTKEIILEDNEIALNGCRNKFQSLINYQKKYAMITPKIEEYIISFVNEKGIDLVFFDSSIFGRTLVRVKKETNAKTICFMHNIEAYYALNKVKNESLLYFTMYRAYMYNEKLAVRAADCLISISDRDAQIVKEKYGRLPDYTIGVTFCDTASDYDDCELIESKKEIVDLLFVGSYFEPNVHGIKWFTENVLKYIPARLTIVGKGMEALRSKISDDKLQIFGAVDDLSGFYRKADAMILPIFHGSGMKVKTAEALMYGKIIFASDEALVGYEEIENAVVRCNTAEDYIKAINAYNDKGVVKYSKASRLLYANKYSDSYAKNMFKNILVELVDEAKS